LARATSEILSENGKDLEISKEKQEECRGESSSFREKKKEERPYAYLESERIVIGYQRELLLFEKTALCELHAKKRSWKAAEAIGGIKPPAPLVALKPSGSYGARAGQP